MSSIRSAYLGNRSLPGPWTLQGTGARGFSQAVVIPALAELEHLFVTLDALARNPIEQLAATLVVVVVNQRADADPALREENLATLAGLKRYAAASALQLAWVDAASPGRELPLGRGGVGMARKLGLDLALARLVPEPGGFLASLDADTLVREDYLPSLAAHFAAHPAEAAAIPYCHQPGATCAEQEAITRYELFLRHYVLGLEQAGSPYAYHSIGSALACSPTAYLKAGGMNCRRAGEDFYLLQQLQKSSQVRQLAGTVVYPSARSSSRVPFGTGEKVARLLEGETDAVRFYAADGFWVLADWLQRVTTRPDQSGAALLAGCAEKAPEAAEFLTAAGFVAVWERLQRNHRQADRLRHAFHGWFDALRTLRFIHHLADHRFGRVGMNTALPPLLEGAGLPTVDKPGELLVLLRSVQTGEPAPESRLPAPARAQTAR